MSQSADKFRARLPVRTVTAEIRKIRGRLVDCQIDTQVNPDPQGRTYYWWCQEDADVVNGVEDRFYKSSILSTGPRQSGNKNAQYK